jgi:NAD(P)-dependent dehydrogenase (short-subunit alcohol dehydrogenase family)
MLSARSTEQLRETETALRATGAEVAAHAADVASPDGAARLIEATVAAYGGIDIIINNVAVAAARGSPTAAMMTGAARWNGTSSRPCE